MADRYPSRARALRQRRRRYVSNDTYLGRIPTVHALFTELHRIGPRARANLPVSRPDLADLVLRAYLDISPPIVPRDRVPGVRTRFRRVLRGNGVPLHLIF